MGLIHHPFWLQLVLVTFGASIFETTVMFVKTDTFVPGEYFRINEFFRITE